MNVLSSHAAIVEAPCIAFAQPADGLLLAYGHDGRRVVIAAACPKARAPELASCCRRPSPLMAAFP